MIEVKHNKDGKLAKLSPKKEKEIVEWIKYYMSIGILDDNAIQEKLNFVIPTEIYNQLIVKYSVKTLKYDSKQPK